MKMYELFWFNQANLVISFCLFDPWDIIYYTDNAEANPNLMVMLPQLLQSRTQSGTKHNGLCIQPQSDWSTKNMWR